MPTKVVRHSSISQAFFPMDGIIVLGLRPFMPDLASSSVALTDYSNRFFDSAGVNNGEDPANADSVRLSYTHSANFPHAVVVEWDTLETVQ